MSDSKNVLGEKLELCCTDPVTGFFVMAYAKQVLKTSVLMLFALKLPKSFWNLQKPRGNNLSTPVPSYNFPGLKPGNKWCLCVSRWKEALDAGVAPPIVLEATHEAALNVVPLEVLQEHALNL
jgi:uncharacterized protein (DUF2237 family)